jgi:D-3-phosphoglycerate dehydrogenase
VKVLICDPVEREVVAFLRQRLEVQECADPNGTDADAIIVRSRTRITRAVIESASNLKVIGRQGVGIDNIDVEAARARGIIVLNTPDALTESVAELAVGLMIAVAREIPRADRGLKEGRWLKGQLRQVELSGKTLGILGLGRIGAKVASICSSMGMRTVYWSRSRKPELEKELSLTYVNFADLFKQADFLSIHLALTPETKGIVGRKEIYAMKPTAFLINTSRGAVVDEEALYEALRDGKLAGAALDVFDQEPYYGKLRELPNVVLTPHIGSDTHEAQLRSGISLAEKIIEALEMWPQQYKPSSSS